MRPMARVAPFDRRATYDDLVKVPDIQVAEIVDGELHATPRPAPRHAYAGSLLGAAITGPYARGLGGPGGWWILDGPELHLGGDVLVRDLAAWRTARMPRLPDTAFFPVAPDWICEVTSPSTASLDRGRKLAIYARERVGHAWIIDPAAGTLEVFGLESGRWTLLATHAGADVVRAEPFDGMDLELKALWADP